MSTILTSNSIVILGAGPAGAAAALFLAKQGVASTVIDKASFPRDKVCGDALSGKVVEVLNKLDKNLVYELAGQPNIFLPSWGVNFVAPSGEMLRVPFQTQKEKSVAPGFIAKRTDFDNWLVEKLKQHPLITLHENTEVRDVTKNENWLLTSKCGKKIEARLVIACDGAYSTFSKQVAQLKTEPAHNCFGLRAYYKGVKGLDDENFIELHFLKNVLPGYFWIFPLPDGYANVGIGMRADKLHDRKLNLKKLLEQAVADNPAIAKRFEKTELVDGIKLFGLPLGSKKRPLSGNGYLLCGDAAQLIDPFTGEGIGNAMMSGMYAASTAAMSISQNDCSASFLKKYDADLYDRLWSELQLSYTMQRLVSFPWLFNLVVRKANSNALLRETISCMFEDMDMRARLSNPMFYLKLLFSPTQKLKP